MISRKFVGCYAMFLEGEVTAAYAFFLCPLEAVMNDIRRPARVKKVRRLDLSGNHNEDRKWFWSK